MKAETLRRVLNIKKLLRRGADIWETGNYRLLWFDDPTPTLKSKGMLVYHCRKSAIGHLRFP